MSDYVGDTVSCVRFTRDGQCILVSAVSSSLKLFDKATGEMLQEFMGHINKDYRYIVRSARDSFASKLL